MRRAAAPLAPLLLSGLCACATPTPAPPAQTTNTATQTTSASDEVTLSVALDRYTYAKDGPPAQAAGPPLVIKAGASPLEVTVERVALLVRSRPPGPWTPHPKAPSGRACTPRTLRVAAHTTARVRLSCPVVEVDAYSGELAHEVTVRVSGEDAPRVLRGTVGVIAEFPER